MNRTLATCGLALLLLPGCSSGDKDAAPPTSRPGDPATTVDNRFTGQGSAEFCNLARTYNDRFTKIDARATPAQLRTAAREGQAAIAQAVNAAPAEIKPDVQVISTAFGSVLDELEKVNFDASKLTLTAFAKLQAPEFATSTQRFQAYAANVCKITG